MARKVAGPVKPAQARKAAAGGYLKGDETRQRLLDAALTVFGEDSFRAATTRRIAAAAGVSLPTLQYYFGGKEGLYRACAEAIVERYRRHTASAAATALAALDRDRSPAAARRQLKALIGALAGFLVGTREAEGWASFVTRELREPGPAYAILYERLWRPGVETTGRLVARILGCAPDDPAARLQALLLISSLTSFQSGRSIALRTLGWKTIGPDELALVRAALDAQIDSIGRN
jgi:AcrR family transcriptional regulator